MSNSASGDDIGRLHREVTDADDEQLRRIVGVVDGLADRRAADALIAPLRPRLAAIRPPRPLRLPRLIFMPLEPLIVARNRWQPGEPSIPRTVLLPLAEAALAGLGSTADELRRRASAHDTSNAAVVAAIGEVLWPAAALALRSCPPPAGWLQETGLRAEDFEILARPIAALLEHGSMLHSLSFRGTPSEPRADPEALLGSVAQAGEGAVAMLLVLLLQVLPNPAVLLGQAGAMAVRLPPSGRAALDRAVEFVLDELDEASAADAEATPDLRELWRGALLVRELRSKAGPRPPAAAKLQRIERNLDGIFRREFGAAAAFVAALPQTSTAAAGPVADCDVRDMEATARELRRLEMLGRGLGGANYYDAALRQTSDTLANAAGLSIVDRLRLTEILLGSDAADVLASEILEAPTR